MKFPTRVGAGGRPRCVFGSRWGLGPLGTWGEEGAALIPPLSPPGVTVGPHCGAHTLRLHHLCRTCGTGPDARHVPLGWGQYLVTATAGCSTVHVNMYCTFSARFKRCFPSVTELAGGSRGHKAGYVLEVGTVPGPLPLSYPQQAESFPGSSGMWGKQDTKALSATVPVSSGPHSRPPLPGVALLWPCSQAAWLWGWGDTKERRGDGLCQCPWGARGNPFCSIPKPRLLGF